MQRKLHGRPWLHSSINTSEVSSVSMTAERMELQSQLQRESTRMDPLADSSSLATSLRMQAGPERATQLGSETAVAEASEGLQEDQRRGRASAASRRDISLQTALSHPSIKDREWIRQQSQEGSVEKA